MVRKIFTSKWTSRYLFALGIIAILLIGVNLITHSIIETEKNQSALINLSGKQRMLTKEIAMQSIQFASTKAPQERERFRKSIVAAAEEMKTAKDKLLASASPIIRTIYLEHPKFLGHQIDRYIEEAIALAGMSDRELFDMSNRHLDYIVDTASGELLLSLDEAASLFQQESETKILQLQKIETVSLVLALIVLLFEALFIFRPMIKAIEQEKNKLTTSNEELKRLSFVDGLTEVANRRYFDEFFLREWERALRDRTPISLIMIDIDYFKAYNDTYGHQAGDQCLQQVAQLLRDIVKRSTDLAARYGGEEFAVVLPNTNMTGATSIAEALRTGVEMLHIPHSGSSINDFVTISLGVSTISPEPNLSPNSLIGFADSALYRAKQSGRNNVVVLTNSAGNLHCDAAATVHS